MDASREAGGSARREVFVGRHSRVWQRLQPRLTALGVPHQAVAHGELAGFEVRPTDRLWILSYSRRGEENLSLLQAAASRGPAELVYVSSSSTIACRVARCWRYPTLKQQAEDAALAHAQARVLTLGLVHDDEAELPAGRSAATALDRLADFVAHPAWPPGERTLRLFTLVDRPFASTVERRVHGLYGRAQAWLGARACLLRPADAVLRLLGWRWYGYVYLSNRLWTSTTS